ncbi:amino acid ABC transporter permease [Trinickia mobilis]|uniref:amino acid ABC transporter permease n=1 Tax=Trinickia mobilis TaxID=2816356 RepID=UPI001A8F3923|nr:amino acid ABC transporter permease [Trinickia mobilis]
MSIDLNVVSEAVPVLLRGLKVSATVSAIGVPLGALAGTVAAYMADSKTWWLRSVALGYVDLVRNIPFLIVVYLSFFGLPKLGIHASAFAVAIGTTVFYTGGYFCEILRAAFKSVPRGQVRAAQSLGMRGWQVQLHVVVPQIFGFVTPPATSLAIMMFKDSSIFSVMSLPELTYQSNLLTADTFAYVEVLGTTALIYWGCSVLIDACGQFIELRVRRWSHR